MPSTSQCPNPEPYVALLRSTPARTVCPNFYLLDHARGCNFNCSYCFLRDIEYNRKERRLFDDTDRLFAEIRDWVDHDNLETYLANAGNMTDGLSFENERPIWGDLVELMRGHAEKRNRPHCLLVVTKAGLSHCRAFLEHKPPRNVIVSFSINAPEAARDHEAGAAPSAERIAAANKLIELGWRVRVRMDPMIQGYDYTWVTEEVRRMAPERVTLGTLRADPTLLPEVRGVGIFAALDEPEPESIARYPREVRMAMYGPVVERLRDVTSLGLCEETEDIWADLGLDYVNKTCNCNHI
ncbi:MAG: radical SAM protein [Planctomycetaceae bacterium]|nr:radical SAM protein [Planctomycetaceae bacterium]